MPATATHSLTMVAAGEVSVMLTTSPAAPTKSEMAG